LLIQEIESFKRFHFPNVAIGFFAKSHLWGLGAMTGQRGRNFAPRLREQDAVISGKMEDYFQTPKPKTGPAKGSTNKKRGRPPKSDKVTPSGSTSYTVATLAITATCLTDSEGSGVSGVSGATATPSCKKHKCQKAKNTTKSKVHVGNITDEGGSRTDWGKGDDLLRMQKAIEGWGRSKTAMTMIDYAKQVDIPYVSLTHCISFPLNPRSNPVVFAENLPQVHPGWSRHRDEWGESVRPG